MSDWTGCYGEAWSDIVPEAFAHPAKFSRALIRRIYEHATEEGWLRPGDAVVDPFGGVALGALEAMRLGLHWTGMELEPRFVDLGTQNIALWNARYSRLPHWGTATLLPGDSRHLAALVGQAGACVSSPPYEALGTKTGKVDENAWTDGKPRPIGLSQKESLGYGTTPGNLGNMRGGYDAAVSSPPWDGGEPALSPERQRTSHSPTEHGGPGPQYAQYSDTVGQLANMRGGFEGCISSPPYAEAISYQRPGAGGEGNELMRQGYTVQEIACMRHEQDPRILETRRNAGYSRALNNIANSDATAFWPAARAIVAQVYQVLKPGGVAIWVLKAYVRDKQIVDFPGQWRQMCEAAGFTTLHEHRAWLVEERGTQHTLDNGTETRTVHRKSFFRRLAERKGSPAIDWETVLCQVKR